MLDRIKQACFGSVTIALQYAAIIFGALVEIAGQLPEVLAPIQPYIPEQFSAKWLIAMAVLTVLARLRTINKAGD